MSEESKAVVEETKKPARRSAGKDTRWEVYWPRSATSNRKAIFVASFPPIVYFWPGMMTFLMCGLLQWATKIPEGTLGWIAVLVFAVNIMVIVQDFDQKKFLILILLVLALGLGAWIINMKGFLFLKNMVGALIDLNPTFSTSAYFILGGVLAILFLWGLVRPMFDYWRLEHNEFVHYIQPFGRDQSIPRSGSTVVKQVPDMLEFILTLGGGSLVITREERVWATIPHIPFLGRRMKAIEKMLSETRVTTMEE